MNFSFLQPLQHAFQVLVSYIPQLIGALIILIIGYIIAKIVQKVITKVLTKIGFNNWMDRAGVGTFLSRMSTSKTAAGMLGLVVFWFVFIITLTMVANALGVPAITDFLNRMIAYIPRVFAAIGVLFLAALAGNFLSGIVRGATGSSTLGSVVRVLVIVYAIFIALTVLGIAASLTGTTFLIMLGGVALAGGIAFGWGGRGIAEDLLQRFVRSQQEQLEQQERGRHGGEEG